MISSYVWIGILGAFFLMNWVIIFPIAIYMTIIKIKEKWHKKSEQEIENENRIKAIRKIPNLKLNGKLSCLIYR